MRSYGSALRRITIIKDNFSYTFTIGRISDEFKREYVERISKEFKRAQDLDELDMNVFTPRTRERINLLIKIQMGIYQNMLYLKESLRQTRSESWREN